jgi:phosphatidylglycerophosphatase C
MKAAFFDFDGTLINGISEHLFFWYLIKTKRINLAGSLLRFLALALIKLRFDSALFREYKPYIHNIDKSSLTKYSEDFYKKKIRKRLRKGVVNKMLSLQKRGFTIVMVTATLDILVNPFLKEFRIAHAFSSIYTPTKSIFRKNIKNVVPYGENKKSYIVKFAKGHSILLKDSYAFGDSRADTEMMGIVGHSVWV